MPVSNCQYRGVGKMRQYRLIYDQPTTGARNMAVDEAIMSAVAAGDSPPTLRLYAWDPPTLSLGYGQPWQDADLARLQRLGWGIVRRITGGRAILHTDELTYSIALPADHPLATGTIIESYRRISRALVHMVESFGTTPQADQRAERIKPSQAGPVCFEVPSHYEITTADHRKLIGSAQGRRRGVVLQHGSLPLYGDITRIVDALAYPTEHDRKIARNRVRGRAATLADALNGQHITWEHAANQLALAFARTFDANLVEDTLTAAEQTEAHRLERDLYATDAHIRRL